MSRDLETASGAGRHLARWQKAQQHLLHGRPDLALGIYQELLKLFPDTARLWHELAFAAGKELNFALADVAAQRAAALAPGMSLCWCCWASNTIGCGRRTAPARVSSRRWRRPRLPSPRN